MKKKPIKLNDEQLLLEASQLSDMYHQLTLDLFDQVIERIKARGSASLADNPYLWQANKLHEAGLLNADNIKLIAKYSSVAEAQLRHVIENEGFKIYKNTSEQLEEALGRESGVNSTIQDDLSNYARQAIDDVHNLINTTLPISVIGAYQGIIQDAVAGVVTGLKTPDQAINQTVIKWFKRGFMVLQIKQGENGEQTLMLVPLSIPRLGESLMKPKKPLLGSLALIPSITQKKLQLEKCVRLCSIK